MSDRAIGVVLLLFCALMWWQAYSIRTPPFAQFQQLDSPFFPRVVLIVLAFFSAILAVRGSGRLFPAGGIGTIARFVRDHRKILITMGMFVAYVLLIPLLGYVPTTAVYLGAMQLFLRWRSPRGIAIVALSSAISAYVLARIFVEYLHVVLPQGEI